MQINYGYHTYLNDNNLDNRLIINLDRSSAFLSEDGLVKKIVITKEAKKKLTKNNRSSTIGKSGEEDRLYSCYYNMMETK